LPAYADWWGYRLLLLKCNRSESCCRWQGLKCADLKHQSEGRGQGERDLAHNEPRKKVIHKGTHGNLQHKTSSSCGQRDGVCAAAPACSAYRAYSANNLCLHAWTCFRMHAIAEMCMLKAQCTAEMQYCASAPVCSMKTCMVMKGRCDYSYAQVWCDSRHVGR